MGGFRDLAVYELSGHLSDELRAVVLTWPAVDRWTCGVQASRAADSVGANIAEAFGRQSWLDKSRLLVIARGSANELQHWLARAAARGLPLPPEALPRADRVGRMLNGLRSSYQQPATSN